MSRISTGGASGKPKETKVALPIMGKRIAEKPSAEQQGQGRPRAGVKATIESGRGLGDRIVEITKKTEEDAVVSLYSLDDRSFVGVLERMLSKIANELAIPGYDSIEHRTAGLSREKSPIEDLFNQNIEGENQGTKVNRQIQLLCRIVNQASQPEIFAKLTSLGHLKEADYDKIVNLLLDDKILNHAADTTKKEVRTSLNLLAKNPLVSARAKTSIDAALVS